MEAHNAHACASSHEYAFINVPAEGCIAYVYVVQVLLRLEDLHHDLMTFCRQRAPSAYCDSLPLIRNGRLPRHNARRRHEVGTRSAKIRPDQTFNSGKPAWASLNLI